MSSDDRNMKLSFVELLVQCNIFECRIGILKSDNDLAKHFTTFMTAIIWQTTSIIKHSKRDKEKEEFFKILTIFSKHLYMRLPLARLNTNELNFVSYLITWIVITSYSRIVLIVTPGDIFGGVSVAVRQCWFLARTSNVTQPLRHLIIAVDFRCVARWEAILSANH